MQIITEVFGGLNFLNLGGSHRWFSTKQSFSVLSKKILLHRSHRVTRAFLGSTGFSDLSELSDLSDLSDLSLDPYNRNFFIVFLTEKQIKPSLFSLQTISTFRNKTIVFFYLPWQYHISKKPALKLEPIKLICSY